jgi:hypothetical protein
LPTKRGKQNPNRTQQLPHVDETRLGVWGGTKATRFVGHITRREICIKKEKQRSTRWSNSLVSTAQHLLRNYQRPGKNVTQNDYGEETTSVHTSLGIVSRTPNQNGKLH